MQEDSPGTDSPRDWLKAYFRTRAHLAGCESEFQCDPACTRPGCKNKMLLIPVSLVDLMGAALHRDEPVSAMYRRHYTLGLLPQEPHDWIRTVCLRLIKPCPFLEDDRCSIYPVRPLACILFPEYLVSEGRFEAEAGKDHFQDFLCLHSTIHLSPGRAELMGRLKWMWEREMLLSSFFLFTHSRSYVDFSNCTEELLRAMWALRDADSTETHDLRDTIPNRVMEQFLQERMAGCPTLGGVAAKIDSLDTPEGQARFLGLGQDDGLMAELMTSRDERELILRFVKGRLKATRRSLLPAEYKFY